MSAPTTQLTGSFIRQSKSLLGKRADSPSRLSMCLELYIRGDTPTSAPSKVCDVTSWQCVAVQLTDRSHSYRYLTIVHHSRVGNQDIPRERCMRMVDLKRTGAGHIEPARTTISPSMSFV